MAKRGPKCPSHRGPRNFIVTVQLTSDESKQVRFYSKLYGFKSISGFMAFILEDMIADDFSIESILKTGNKMEKVINGDSLRVR